MNGMIDLAKYDNSWYKPGRGRFVRAVWYFVNSFCLQSRLNPSSQFKIAILRFFGAKIGNGVVLKCGINVKYPWNLEIGDYCWIGENAWLDSLAHIKIGSNVCVSQGVYVCTGNHDWSDPYFGLIVKPVIVEDGAWLGARCTILSGVRVAGHSIVTAGAVVSKDTEPYMIYAGNPAVAVKKRHIREHS